MALTTADPIRQALAARTLLGFLAGRWPTIMTPLLDEAAAWRVLADDARQLAEETRELAIRASNGDIPVEAGR